MPIPRPKALRYMNWLHFPKCVDGEFRKIDLAKLRVNVAGRDHHSPPSCTTTAAGVDLLAFYPRRFPSPPVPCRHVKGARRFTTLKDPQVKEYQGRTCQYCWDPCKGCFTTWAPHDGLQRIKGGRDDVRVPFMEKHCAATHLGL